MKNLGNLMKQAQEMQEKMAQMQEKMLDLEAIGNAAASMVQITINGKHHVKQVKIDKSLIKADEAEILEDLLVAAYNDAAHKIEAKIQEEMSKVTGGLTLPPGIKFPF